MKYIQTDKIFIDSNLWIYLSITNKDVDKHKKILQFFEKIATYNIYTSIQVINEFHWVLLRKYKLSENQIYEKVENGIIQLSKVNELNINTYKYAKQIRNNYEISFWDSLILSSAFLNNCSVIYTEDMQHNLIIDNKLKIINPFKLTN